MSLTMIIVKEQCSCSALVSPNIAYFNDQLAHRSIVSLENAIVSIEI